MGATRQETRLRIELSEPVSVSVDTGETVPIRGAQPATVLAYLAIERRPVTIEEIADVVWADRLGPHWRGAVRGILSKLRTALTRAGAPTDAIRSEQGAIQLTVPASTDLDRADELLTALGSGDPVDIDELRDTTIALRSPILATATSEWADSLHYRIGALVDRFDHLVLERLRAGGRTDEALDWARERISRHPLDLAARTALVELLTETGDPTAPIEFERFRKLLDEEFGTEPPTELRDVVLRLEPGPAVPDLGPTGAHHPHAGEPFVGRTEELATIRHVWDRLRDTGRPELLFIDGPSGIGKTRLADHAASTLPDARVLWGRSRPGAERSFGPVADALATEFDRNRPFARAANRLDRDLGLLVPDAPGLTRDEDATTGPTSPTDPAGGRGDTRERALRAARTVIGALLDRPTILVADDLQWATPDGLAAIDSLLVDTTGPLLLIATGRDLPAPVGEHLAALERLVTVTTIELGPLPFDAIDQLVRQLGDDTVDTIGSTPAETILERTGGVPFFATELVREARRSRVPIADVETPASVEAWLDHFLTSLDDPVVDVLEIATVFGTGVRVDDLVTITELPERRITAAVDVLTAHGLLTIDTDGRVRVPHDLITGAVEHRLTPARRMFLHRTVGDLLAARDERPELQAHHWSLAGESRRDDGFEARIRAAESALAGGAWGTALHHLERNLERDTDPRRRVRALIGTGRARLHLGHHDDARTTVVEALERALELGLTTEVAQATLLLAGRAGRGALLGDDAGQERHLRTAHRHLLAAGRLRADPDLDLLIARIEVELALALLFTADDAERITLLDNALGRVRGHPDPPPSELAAVLLAQRVAAVDADALDERIADLDAVLALPHDELPPDVLAAAHLYRHEDMLRSGRRTEALLDLERARHHAERIRHPYWMWAVRTWQALGDAVNGDLETALAGAREAASARETVPEAQICLQVNTVAIRLLGERSSEILDLLESAVDLQPHIPAFAAVLALALAEAGDHVRCRQTIDALLGDDSPAVDRLPRDSNRFLALGVLAHASATIGHETAASRLNTLLEPFDGQHLLINCFGGGGAHWGPVSWALARLGPLVGRSEEEIDRLWTRARIEGAVTPALAARIDAEADQRP